MTFYYRGPPSNRVMNPLVGELGDAQNGAFLIEGPFRTLRIIASNGYGWEHVSVSIQARAPNWQEMCFAKDLFWSEDDCAVQFHPARAHYRNYHPNCLHLWRQIGVEMAVPDPNMVGPS